MNGTDVRASYARDPSMHCEPRILNHAYAKTVKLNPAISTQEWGVEKPRAAPAAEARKSVEPVRRWRYLHASPCDAC